MNALLETIASALGYEGDPGFVLCEAFDRQPNHRHALRLAEQRMGVRSAFGLWTGRAGAMVGPDHRRFTPLVYLAVAKDERQVKEIHRRVWSQGLAPHLIVATECDAWICQGFAYSSTNWAQHAVRVETEFAIDSEKISGRLKYLTARSLRSSIAWRDEARSGDDFVDERLLGSLAELSTVFSKLNSDIPTLTPAATNALIARLLYFYFLVDRGFVTSERLDEWGLSEIEIDGDTDWPLEATHRLFERLDEVFNGSIFPISPMYESALDASHINDIRRVLRHGGHLHAGGVLQFGFLDYDFASVRTETLSAIYEMFLRNEEADAGRRWGAFYTPPYLADYLLDRLEDEQPLTQGIRVLDPAAGSGVFLVGAYRRIVETVLKAGETQLPLEVLHGLMTESIFGVELNDTACHVAAFSLYLTMLDYADPSEAADYTAWPIVTGRPRLFPPMLTAESSRDSNIRVGDFFSESSDELRCDVVVGNPPWIQLPKLGSQPALDYERQHRIDWPIGDRQSAELFAWKAMHNHLDEGGVLSLLLPQKSLVNTFSRGFSAALRQQSEIVGIADLAHLRYILFRRSSARSAALSASEYTSRSARHSAAAVIVRKQAPRDGHRFWSFRPLRPTQPATRKGRLWILIHDWTQVQWHLQADLDEERWPRVFTCSAVDRKILSNLDRRIEGGRLTTLGALQKSVGLQFKIEVDRQVDREYVLGTNRRSRNYWVRQLGLDGESLLPGEPKAVPLPRVQIERATPNTRPFLQGNIVLMPRSCDRAVFVEPPVAFSFMIGACFPDLAGRVLPEQNREFLQALAAYMSTDVFRYLCFVSGRRMMIDRASVELSTVKNQPWPFGGLGNRRIREFLGASTATQESLALDALGIPSAYRAAIDEFSDFRQKFRDGGNPKNALSAVSIEELATYMQVLLSEIDGEGRHYDVARLEIPGSDLNAITVSFTGDEVPFRHPLQTVDQAIAAFRRQGASGLSQSRYLWHSRTAMQTVLIKPLERLHWTRDRAFADADLITAAIMLGFDSREAA